jgi:hypothetical protein
MQLAASGKVDAAIAAGLRPPAPVEPKPVAVEAASITPPAASTIEASDDAPAASPARPERAA